MKAAQDRDTQAIPRLVEQLDNDDPVVRLLAIRALEQITGTRMGYNPYGSPAERRPAIEAWVKAAREGTWKRRSSS